MILPAAFERYDVHVWRFRLLSPGSLVESNRREREHASAVTVRRPGALDGSSWLRLPLPCGHIDQSHPAATHDILKLGTTIAVQEPSHNPVIIRHEQEGALRAGRVHGYFQPLENHQQTHGGSHELLWWYSSCNSPLYPFKFGNFLTAPSSGREGLEGNPVEDGTRSTRIFQDIGRFSD